MIIGGDLLIRGPRAVTRNGFEYDNFEKTDIASLEPLRPVLAVRGSVNLQRNPKLDSLSGLENLRWVGESLRIEGNEGLEDLQGLDSLERVGGNLRIFAEPPLRSLRGLESLRTIEGTLTLGRLEALGSLSALQLSRPPAEIELTDVDALMPGDLVFTERA
ncbi:MAG: hypothetical protein ABEL76_17210, partial [Bradymonadaceae bacterium]